MRFPTQSSSPARSPAHLPVKPLALAVALALAPHALAGPTGATVVAGQARVTQPDARTTLIRQDSDKAIINWSTFSIGAGQSVQFQQPGSTSVALNRVTTATPSDIQGSLSANGRVFLINPAGILFGKGASVDVGGLVASTLDIRDDDFLAGRHVFAGGAGGVRNQGRLSAAERGTIALLGAEVSNEGTMTARLGTLGLAAGGKVTLDFAGDGLTRIVVDASTVKALVENGGAMIADGGQVIMRAQALEALSDTVVRNHGVAQARTLVERGGRILLDGGAGGKVEVAGTVDAGGTGAGQRGGAVTVTGKDLHLAGTATIDARGTAGGGTVLVGGGERGADPAIAHASSVTMDGGSTIRADALDSGNGGKIVLWSDGVLDAKGSLSARGGARGGDGGFVETSGKTVRMAGLSVNASAARGRSGLWLLDPEDLYIGGEEAETISNTLSNGTDSKSVATGSITLAADIVKRAQESEDGSPLPQTDATFYLEAADDIVMYGGPTIRSESGKLHVDFNSNSEPEVDGSSAGDGRGAIVLDSGTTILTNGGDIRLYGQSDIKNGLARGSTRHEDGIHIQGATLDTRIGDSDIGGAITMRGKGGSASERTIGGTGLHLVGSTLRSGSGKIDLTAWMGTGPLTYTGDTFSAGDNGPALKVDFAYGGEISSTSGAIDLWGGFSRYSDLATSYTKHPEGSIGLSITLGNNASISSSAGAVSLYGSTAGLHRDVSHGTGAVIRLQGGRITGSSVNIWGRTVEGGVRGLDISAPALADSPAISATGQLTLRGSGQSGIGLSLTNVHASGEQISIQAQSRTAAGLYVNDSILGETGRTSLLELRAYSEAPSLGHIAYGEGNTRTSLRAGRIVLRPGGLKESDTEAQLDVPIHVGDNPDASGFVVSMSNLGLGGLAGAHVVIGSSGHRGAINYDASPFTGDLTLQNGGAGSQGISLMRSTQVSGQLALSSGGRVTVENNDHADDPGLHAARLLLHGTQPESTFDLSSIFNMVDELSMLMESGTGSGTSGRGDVSFRNYGNLRLVAPHDPGSGVFNPSGSSVSGNLVVRTTGDLTLATNLRTPNGSTTLVTDGVFLNGGGTLSTANGWRVFANTWIGEERGGLTPALSRPNYYNCTYGAACAGAIDGNRFIYRQQPKLTLTPTEQTREYGSDSTLTYTVSGLVNGDTVDDALSGGYAPAALRTPVGTHDIAGSFTSPVGYEVEARTGRLTVTPATLLVSIDDKEKVYGGEDPRLTASLSGFVFDDTEAVVSGLTLTTATSAAATAGTHAITGSDATAANYRFVYQPGTLTVSKAPLTVIVDDKFKTYGGADPLLTASYSGLQYGDSPSAIGALLLSTATGAAATAGTHAITGTGGSAANYTLDFRPGTLTVAKAPLQVFIDDKIKTYGDADPLLTASYVGLKYDDSPAQISALALSTATGAAATAGTHAITGSGGSAANYILDFRPGTLTVNKAPLVLSADDKRKVYGDPDPAFTVSADGLKYGDSAAVVSGLRYSAPSGARAGAGRHAITVSDGSAANYTLSYLPGTLTVDQAPLQVIVADAAKTYGDPEPELTASYAGLRYDDTAAVVGGLRLSTASGAAATAGTHAIAGSGASAANYRIEYRNGVLTVDKATLQVLIGDRAKTYGDPDPALGATFTGLRYSDTASVVSGLQLSAPTGKAASAGTHAITGAGATAANYRFVYQPGVLDVAKAPLQVVADDKIKTYGDADPLLTARYSGLKYDDSPAAIGSLLLSTATGAAATAGTHAITGTGGSAANYTVDFRPGTLTVNKAPLLVTADDRQKVYGDPEPVYGASVSGLKYSDSAAVVSGLRFAAPSGAQAGAGQHAITVSDGTAANYALSYRPGTLSVAKAPLTISADGKAKVYGAADPALTASMSGFKYGDTPAVVQGLVLSTATGKQATAGTHAILAANASALNYQPIYLPGTLTVDQAVLTYVATPATQVQGLAPRPLAGTVTGFAYDDSLASATTGTLAFTSAALAAALPGSYGVEGGGLSAANYRFVQAAGNASALTMAATPVLATPVASRNVSFESSSVYEKNFGTPRLCIGTGPLGTGTVGADSNDLLALEWSRVRVSPNLSNCLGIGQRNSCSDF